MTVKELIKKLQEYNPELDVEIEMWDGYSEIKSETFYIMYVDGLFEQREILIIDTTR